MAHVLVMPARNLSHPVVIFVAAKAADHSLHAVRLPSRPGPPSSDSRRRPSANEPTVIGVRQSHTVDARGVEPSPDASFVAYMAENLKADSAWESWKVLMDPVGLAQSISRAVPVVSELALKRPLRMTRKEEQVCD
jgi:hypothetical protein